MLHCEGALAPRRGVPAGGGWVPSDRRYEQGLRQTRTKHNTRTPYLTRSAKALIVPANYCHCRSFRSLSWVRCGCRSWSIIYPIRMILIGAETSPPPAWAWRGEATSWAARDRVRPACSPTGALRTDLATVIALYAGSSHARVADGYLIDVLEIFLAWPFNVRPIAPATAVRPTPRYGHRYTTTHFHMLIRIRVETHISFHPHCEHPRSRHRQSCLPSEFPLRLRRLHERLRAEQ